MNLTNKELPVVRLFYKYFYEDENTFLGGITYSASAEKVPAGGSVTVSPGHFESGVSIFMGSGVYLSAAVLLTLAHYDTAGFYHGQRHTRRFLFCTLTGTFLALASFADGLSLFQMAMAAACILPLLGQTYALLSPEIES